MKGNFVHLVGPPVIKWVARARTGALATCARQAGTGLGSSPTCSCCNAPSEDDTHAVAGCPETGAGDCAVVAANHWLRAAGKRGVSPTPLPGSWVETHLVQLAVALIPASLRSYAPGLPSSVVNVILQDFHRGLAERLALVLRRREELVAKNPSSETPASITSAAPPRPSRSFLAPIPFYSQARGLTVAEMRAAEHAATTSSASTSTTSQRRAHPPPPPKVVQAQARAAAASLRQWLKAQPHLHAADLEKGEPAVALLFLWEADHDRLYPSRAADLALRVITFSKRLQEAVAADTELSEWMQSRRMKTTLAPGLPTALLLPWSVTIHDAVGEPFLSSWKVYIASLLAKRTTAPLAALDPACQSPRRKRQNRSAEPHRRGVKRARASSSAGSSSAASRHPATRY